MIERLQHHAHTQPDQLAYAFLDESLDIESRLTYGELHRRACHGAAHLRQHVQQGDRVLLLYPSGIDFVLAFWACLYAGVVPLPIYPPSRSQRGERLRNIVADASAAAALTSSAWHQKCLDWLSSVGEEAPLPVWSSTEWESVATEPMAPVRPEPQALAFIQYTSGSTGKPKGVMITHANLRHNQSVITEAFGTHPGSIGCGWLPTYHDMGLVGNLLNPVHVGYPIYLMTPQAFVRNPLAWLRAISKYRVTTSGAPNFAYQACAQRAGTLAQERLDLSCWTLAFCGAEPIRPQSMAEFARSFEAHGFESRALYPCYGMAEATLFITGPHRGLGIQVDALREERVSCGQPLGGSEVLIVDPQHLMPCEAGQEGEIWVRSGSVASGYWNKPEETRETFSARTADGLGPCLRTGDLGFLRQGALYVTGRIKDLIILRGRNVHAQDLEASLQAVHPGLNADRCAAFSLDLFGAERLALMIEVHRSAMRQLDGEQAVAAIVRRLQQCAEVAVDVVVVLRPGALPITSSGKVRRSACRQLLEAGDSAWVHRWQSLSLQAAASGDRSLVGDQTSKVRADKLIAWLRAYAHKRINSRLMDERRSIAPHIVLDFGNQGIFGMTIPERHGGLGLTELDALRVVQQLGAIDLNLAGMVGVHLALGVRPILRHGTPELQRALLPALAQGRMIGAFALTEPGAGSSPRHLQSQARRTAEGDWLIAGEKSWIGNAGWSGLIHVFAQAVDADGRPLGMGAFAVDTQAEGVNIGPEAMTMGMRAMVQNTVVLDAVRVDAGRLLGTPGKGFDVAQDAMWTGRLGIAAMCVGALQRVCQIGLRYAERRQIGTGLLLDNPLTQQRLAWCMHAAMATEGLVERLAGWRDAGRELPAELYAVIKIIAPECLWQGVDWLMQLLGGRGYSEPNEVAQLMRDARLLRIFEGPTETLQMHLGQAYLRQPRDFEHWLAALSEDGAPSAHYVDFCRRLPSPPVDPHRQRWMACLLGELLPWFALQAVVVGASRAAGGSQHSATLAWLEPEIDRRVQALWSHLASSTLLPPASDLAVGVGRFAARIGDIEQSLPGEDWSLDRLLRQAVPTAATAQPASALDQDEVLPGQAPFTPQPLPQHDSARRIEDWLLAWIGKALKLPEGGVTPATSLLAVGLDSLSAAECVAALEDWLGCELSPELVWESSCIADMAQRVAAQLRAPAARPAPTPAQHAPEQPATAAVPQQTPSETKGETLPAPAKPAAARLSVFFFGASQDELSSREAFEFILDCARQADRGNFEAIWIPERHFHPFGGHFPNPSVLAAALARETSRIQLRAGSVVLPLHHPARVAEEWATVDHLSGGRVGLAVTPGWGPQDFVLNPGAYAQRYEQLPESMATLRALWRGQAVSFLNARQEQVDIQTFPRPLQPELPLWLTCNRRREGFVQAGQLGVGVLTALLSQSLDELRQNIRLYRDHFAQHAPAGARPQVTLMVHAYVGEQAESTKQRVRAPLTAYLRSSVDLWRQGSEQLESLSASAQDQLLAFAFERYYASCTLMGSADEVRAKLHTFLDAGVDEVACLVDFGLPTAEVLASLQRLSALQSASQGHGLSQACCSRPWPRPLARQRLFCFPYAGAGSNPNAALAHALGEDTELVELHYPPGVTTMAQLVAEIRPQMQPLLDKPFAFYGHSLGALVAYECLQALGMDGPRPRQLFVAAQRAPDLAYKLPSVEALHADPGGAYSRSFTVAHGLAPDAEITPAQWQRIVAGMADGIRMQSQTYRFQAPGHLLDIPLTAFHGQSDPWLDEAEVAAWAAHTRGRFELVLVPGAHVFRATALDRVCEHIRRAMLA